MLAANALWSLVRFADHLPTPKVASTALKCASVMLDHTDDHKWRIGAPVRVAAAHAVHQLLEVHFEDEDAVKPHLPELFSRILGMRGQLKHCLWRGKLSCIAQVD